ncbi:MAG: chromosome segregation protein SMC [Desulfobacterales bacterium]|nr:MAG: chromosome segregation protein SMC [Desulfobacterales bacterium]
MKLKKLEMSGFKSFVDKTSIEFPPGVSAVVGPNGCGKSNVVDALRWVMGEQSVKQLRGKSMEDVIFSGSNGKPALNMAEVSLILLNDNGTVPEELRDFTEIMLTRRLYRSGESAYFINKQPCRLMDIHNIFMGSGMGAKSYAVVQQGSIGAITDAGPEERRYFIEEAAGITRYKKRKTEAIRKIQSTSQNLLRVNDIITEIKRQMAGLKRQARKAERYKKHQDRIRELDIELALYHYKDYTQKINTTDHLIDKLKDTDIEHTSELKKLDAAVEEIKFQRTQKNQDILNLKTHRFESQRRIDRTENDLLHLRKDIQRLTEEFSELESTRHDIEEKNKDLVSEINQVASQSSTIQSEMETVRMVLAREQAESEKIKEQLAVLDHELETGKAELMKLVAQEAQYKNVYQNASTNKEGLQRRLKAIDKEEADTYRKVNGLQKREAQAKEKQASYKMEIDDLKRQIVTLQSEIKDKNSLLGKQIKCVQTLEFERTHAKSTYSTLKKMEDNFDWYKDGVKAIMKGKIAPHAKDSDKKSDSRDDNGIIGLMANVIEPEPSFETAVEAALGESLQYILVKDQKAGIESIRYLRTTGTGRSGFIPVSHLSNTTPVQKKKFDFPNKLLSHVNVEDGFENIAETLLGNVVVAEDIQEAISIFNGNGARQPVVTKDGDIISGSGVMVGGSKDKLSGILTEKRKIKTIRRKITDLNRQLEAARQDQKKMESEVRSIERKLQKLLDLKNKATHNEVEAEKALYRVSEELKHARRHLEIVGLEKEQILGEESDLDQEIEKYNKVVAEIENQVRVAQQHLSERLERIHAVSSEIEDYNQRIIDLKLELTALNASLESSNDTLGRLKEFQHDSFERVGQLAQDIFRKKEKKAASEQKIQEFEQALSGMYDDLKHLEYKLEGNEADYDAIDAKLKDSDTIISDIQSKREETLKKIRLLELEKSQQDIKRENIAVRLQENYSKSILALRSEFRKMPEKPETSIDEMEDNLARLRSKIIKMEDVNLGAIKEYEQLKERFDFLSKHRDDLVKAVDDLHRVIKKINRVTQKRFLETFDAVNEKLNEVFPRLFDGGSARLVLTDPSNPLETGVEFMIHPQGKKLTRMSLLSGGEKALSAIALIFSVFLIKPASFCFMDEIDAPLDDANLFRFNDLLQIVREKSQIVMVTHNKKTMEFADTLFGITMEKKGISKVVSVNFQPAEG